MRTTRITALGLPELIELHWNRYFRAFNEDGNEADVRHLARFVIEARQIGYMVGYEHVCTALPVPEWPAETVEQTADIVDAIHATIDALQQDYKIEVMK